MPTNESPFDWLEKMRQWVSVCAVCKRSSANAGATCETCIRRLIQAPALCARCWLPHQAFDGGVECPFEVRSTRFPSPNQTLQDEHNQEAPPLHAFLYASGHTHEFIKIWKRGDHWNQLDHSLKRVLQVQFQNKWEQIRAQTRADWVVPIPQAYERRMELHGGSAMRFAQLTSQELQIPWVSLLRTTGKSFLNKQSGRSLTQRFESKLHLQLQADTARLWRHPTRLPRLLLVDDIITSGRTFLSTAEFLQAQGYPVAGFVSLGFRPPSPLESTA